MICPLRRGRVSRIELAPDRRRLGSVPLRTLSYGSNDTTITRTELGARMEHSIALQAALLTLRGRAAWAHDEGNDGAVSATFASLPGLTFTINGAAPARDLALVSAGADLRLANNVSLGGSFEGEFSSTTRGYGGKCHIRYVW